MQNDMSITRRGLTLKIDVDYSFNPNPRDNENVIGKMICFHKRYKLGDTHEFLIPSQFDMWVENNQNKIATILPVYLLDHTGLAISTTPFNVKWDSGKIGYIYCLNKDAERIGLRPEEDLDLINEKLKKEVEKYNDYLNNNPKYYYFCLRDENYNIIDTISGFSGKNEKEIIDDMKNYVESKYHFLFDELLKQKENYL